MGNTTVGLFLLAATAAEAADGHWLSPSNAARLSAVSSGPALAAILSKIRRALRGLFRGPEFFFEGLFQRGSQFVVRRSERAALVVHPVLPMLNAGGPPDEVVRLPLVSRRDVRVKKRVRVPLNLQVDPAELWIPLAARAGDGATKSRHVLQEQVLLRHREVNELVYPWRVGDQDAVAGKVLDIANHGEARPHAEQHGRIGARERRPHTVLSKVRDRFSHGRDATTVRDFDRRRLSGVLREPHPAPLAFVDTRRCLTRGVLQHGAYDNAFAVRVRSSGV